MSAPVGAVAGVVLVGALGGAALRVWLRVRRRDALARRVGDPAERPRQRLRWLDPPTPPSQKVLDGLAALLASFPQVTDAWLVRQAATTDRGEEHEQLSLALALDASGDDPHRAAEVLAALTKRRSLRSLGVHNAILVNESIRSATEQHGLEVYSRPSASD
jgi:hypothetical protein